MDKYWLSLCFHGTMKRIYFIIDRRILFKTAYLKHLLARKLREDWKVLKSVSQAISRVAHLYISLIFANVDSILRVNKLKVFLTRFTRILYVGFAFALILSLHLCRLLLFTQLIRVLALRVLRSVVHSPTWTKMNRVWKKNIRGAGNIVQNSRNVCFC